MHYQFSPFYRILIYFVCYNLILSIYNIVPTQQDIHKRQNGPLSCPQYIKKNCIFCQLSHQSEMLKL